MQMSSFLKDTIYQIRVTFEYEVKRTSFNTSYRLFNWHNRTFSLFTILILIQNEDETESQLRRYKNTTTKSLNDLLISIDVDDFNW